MSFEHASSEQVATQKDNPPVGSNFERAQQRLEGALAHSESIPEVTLERWEAQINSTHKRIDVADIDEAAHLAFAEVQVSVDRAKQVLKSKLESLIKRYPKLPLTAGVVAALGLHAPIIKDVEPIKGVIHAVENLTKNTLKGHPEWSTYDAVYQPQSEQEKAEVKQRQAERAARADKQGDEAYSREAEKLIEAGQAPHLKDMVFELERLAGVPAQDTRQAKEIAEKMIARYVEKAKNKGKIDQALLEELTAEMFGGQTVYQWGQASVTDFFLHKKRNCYAVDYAQEMVIEEAILALPEEERKKYSYGSNEVQQHVRTRVTIPIQNIPKSFLLDGYAKAIPNEAPAFSANLSGIEIKKALVATTPLEVQATKGEPGQAEPLKKLLDIKTDQPLRRNVKIVGKLGDSEFVTEQLEKKQVKPVHLSKEAEERIAQAKDTAKPEDIIQVELLPTSTTERLSKGVTDAVGAIKAGQTPIDVWVEVDDIAVQKKEEAAKFLEGAITVGVGSINIGNTEKWSNEAIQEVADRTEISLSIRPNSEGRFDARLIEQWKLRNADSTWQGNQFTGNTLRVTAFPESVSKQLTPKEYQDALENYPMSKTSLEEVFKNLPPRFTEIDIRHTAGRMFASYGNYCEVLLALPRPTTIVAYADMYLNMNSTVRDALAAKGHKFVFELDEYSKILQDRPDVVKNPFLDIREADVSNRDLTILDEAYSLMLATAGDSKKHQDIRALILTAIEKNYAAGLDFRDKSIVERWARDEKHAPLKKRLEKILQFPVSNP